jgi:acetyl-CoA C-acetyltransferase/acetyl-CoA acyltransferase
VDARRPDGESVTAYVHDALRTPRGKARPDGGLAKLPPQELVRQLVDGLAHRVGSVKNADALMLGCVGQVGAQGGNIALIAKLYAGLSDDMASWTINNYCVSGLTAIGQAAGMIAAGTAQRVLAGGVECMSRVPFMADKADYYTDASFPTRTRYLPVALAADRLAQTEQISRAEMDQAALESQGKAAAAEKSPTLLKSRIAVTAADGAVALDREECLRGNLTPESLAALAPAFAALAPNYTEALGGAVDHRHTVAHAPPIADGAGLALVGGRNDSDKRPRARIVAYAESGGDPQASLLAGLKAMDAVLKRAGMKLGDMDRVEFMEAFAVVMVKFLRERQIDAGRLNVGGGHLAKGHPMGGTGVILLSSLLDALDDADGQFGLVVASGASGVGAAMIVERLR